MTLRCGILIINIDQSTDWNGQFQKLIEQLRATDSTEERMKIYGSLAQLAQDFIHCAKTYGNYSFYNFNNTLLGKLIISEGFSF